MAAAYQIAFMPYLALRGYEQLRIADVTIWNYDVQKGAIGDGALGKRIDDLLAMYRQSGHDSRSSARLEDIAMIAVGEPDFRVLSPEEFDRVQEARYLLFICCLSSNCGHYGPNAGHMMFTSENFEVVRQTFVLDREYFSETTGVLLPISILGYTISETRFTKPSYVNQPLRFNTDESLLEALLRLRDDDPLFFRRIVRSAALFLESYYNSHSVDIGARILLQAAAFEVLLELPERAPRKAFKDRIESLANNPEEKTYEYRFETPSGPKPERRTLKGIWADRFYTLRNHIIHGEEVRRRDFVFLHAQHHLIIAPLMFTHSVKRLVDNHFLARKEKRRFFERIDWRVLNEGDEYEPRRVGFRSNADFDARMRRWLSEGGKLA